MARLGYALPHPPPARGVDGVHSLAAVLNGHLVEVEDLADPRNRVDGNRHQALPPFTRPPVVTGWPPPSAPAGTSTTGGRTPCGGRSGSHASSGRSPCAGSDARR